MRAEEKDAEEDWTDVAEEMFCHRTVCRGESDRSGEFYIVHCQSSVETSGGKRKGRNAGLTVMEFVDVLVQPRVVE